MYWVFVNHNSDIIISPIQIWPSCCFFVPNAATVRFESDYVIMSAMASQIAHVSIVNSTVCSGADQRKHQSSASLAFVRGIHRWSVNSPHKGPVTRKMFPFALQTTFSNALYQWVNCVYTLIEMSLKCVPRSSIENKSSLVQGNYLGSASNNLLPDLRLAKIGHVICRHCATMK